MLRYVLCLIALFAIMPPDTTCSQSDQSTAKAEQSADPQLTSDQLGGTVNVHRLDNLFFAGQFQPDDLAEIKSRGVKRIITLRAPKEIPFDERQLVEAAGLEYVEMPIASIDALTDELFGELRELLADEDSVTLFHCGSANRVGGTWLPFRVLDQQVDLETAIAEAEQIGLRSEPIKQKALDYIRRKEAERAEMLTERSSINPKINESFLDPNLKVEDFLERFEVESREIYVNREAIVDACEIQPGMTVADVGSGTGLFTRLFAERVTTSGWVFAVDVSPRLVEHVVAEAAKAKTGHITGVLCPSDRVNLPANSLDVVFICDTYHHFEFPASTMKSIHKALKPSGRLIVVDFERIVGKSRDWVFGHVRAGKDTFRAEIQDAGFLFGGEQKVEGLKENYFLRFRRD